jgi:hypothetical protein
MRCDEFSMEYPDYVSGRVSPEVRLAIDRHVAECAACASRIAELRETFARIDADRLRTTTPVDWAAFRVSLNQRIDEPRRLFRFSVFQQKLLIPLGAAAVIALFLLLFKPWPSRVHNGLISDEMKAIIGSLDSSETALLNDAYVRPITSPASVLPVATASISNFPVSDVQEGLVFTDVKYVDLLAASLEYLDDDTVLDLLPAEQSRQLLESGTAPGNL